MQLKEYSITELQDQMEQAELTAAELSEAFLQRIDEIDRAGPTLRSVIEVNPDAIAIADKLDQERRTQGPRGPLHGVPILVKDNIDSADRMMTTAGSLALEGNIAPRDAFVVEKLRQAGAVLLGKTNLSEWAYFRSTRGCSGWSSRGGQVRNPYALDRNPCGSSSGSGVAVAANLCTASIGTETDGSIVCPSSTNGIVGIKPTIGLVSRSGIVPIAHSQDTAGPMARSVSDVAAVLTALVGYDARDPITREGVGKEAADYCQYLDPDGLKGARLGVARNYFDRHEKADAIIEDAIEELKSLGAIIVDPVDFSSLGLFIEPEFELLLYEFKADLNNYLADHPKAKVRSLEDVISFNRANAEVMMPYFRQELLELAQSKGDLKEEAYLEAKRECLRLSRTEGIDKAVREHHLDAIIAPTNGPAWSIDPIVGDHILGGCSSPAAMAGYPHITVPAGYAYGLPIGLSFFSSAYQEGKLIRYAYAFEQATRVRRPPSFAEHAEA
ncbi:MAG: amidase [Trueperaceae bacterium]|nr:MAG: amidase [Trueperaceae bacterium]